MIQPKQNNQSGFTLLELVVVIAVLGLIANMATEFVAQNTNQQRFDTTKDRQSMIREAILGNPSATQNGEVQVSGFIADTGRAPESLIELITEEYCKSDDAVYTESDCGDWNSLIDGWNGPYLHGYDLERVYNDDGSLKHTLNTFRDGWGNTSSAWVSGSDDKLEAEDVLNFGWNYYTDSGHIYVISAGLDGAKDPTDNSGKLTYEIDYPQRATVFKNEYQSAQKITLNIENSASTSTYLCVTVWKEGDNDKVNIYNPTNNDILHVNAEKSKDKVIEFRGVDAENHGLYNIDVVVKTASYDCSLITNSSGTGCLAGSLPTLLTSKTSTPKLSCVL